MKTKRIIKATAYTLAYAATSTAVVCISYCVGEILSPALKIIILLLLLAVLFLYIYRNLDN